MTMADNTIYDLLDEVNCADSCEAVTALCELIDELLKDIQHLELEFSGTHPQPQRRHMSGLILSASG